MLQKNQLLSKCIVLLGLLVLILNTPAFADSSADAKRVAHLMREIQARVTSLGYDEVAWPACLNGTPAPLYPSDKFYDGETDDPARMAVLVNAIRGAYFLPPSGVPLHRSFLVTGDLEGQSSASATFTDADGFSMPGVATAETWTSVLSAYETNVAKLRYYPKAVDYGNPAGVWKESRATFGDWPGDGDPFQWVVDTARGSFTAASFIPLTTVPVTTCQVAYVSDIQAGAGFMLGAANYKIQAPNTSAIQVYAKLDYSYETEGSSNPPIPDDGKFHIVKRIGAGESFEGNLWPLELTVSINGKNGAGAEWAISAVVGVAEIQVPQADDSVTCCGSCTTCEAGTMTTSLNSLHAVISLGGQGLDTTAGYLQLSAQSLLPRHATPAALVVRANPAVQITRGSGGVLEHIATANTLVDVVVISASKYEIRFSHLQGSPFKTITVENPAGDSSKLRFTESANNRVTEFSQNAATWQMSQGSGLRSELLEVVWNETGTERTETRTIINPDNTPCEKISAIYHNFPWGMEMVSEVRDPDGAALAETWTFYDNPAQDGGGYGRLKMHTTSTGYWERFEYLANGKLNRSIRQFLDAAPGSGDGGNIVTTFTYASGNSQTLAIETIGGQEIGRRYTTDVGGGGIAEAQATVAGAGASDPTNLVTTTWRVVSGDFAGKTAMIAYPNGTMSVYQYEALAGGGIRITESKGGVSGGQVVSGTRTVTEKNSQGGQTSQTITDIAASISILSAQTQSSDANGRPTSILYSDGTSEAMQYDCCGIESFTDREGVQTSYTHDDLGRVSTESALGITKIYDYDGAGHLLSITRRGSDSSDVVTERNQFDLAGRKYQTFDGENRSTTYAESVNGQSHTVRTTTIAGAGSMTEVFYGDGKLKESSGNATYARQYEYSANKVREILVGDAGSTSEWIDSISDLAGRTVRREYPDGAAEQSFYNSLGLLTRRVDPDGVATLYSYDSEGQMAEQAVDADGSGDISSGDRRMLVVRDVIAGPLLRTTTQQGTDAGYTTILEVDQSPNGRYRKEIRYGLETTSLASYSGPGSFTRTTTHPDASTTVEVYSQNLLQSSIHSLSGGGNMESASYQYDAHRRLWKSTDGRTSTVTELGYNQADQVTLSNVGGKITQYAPNLLGQVLTETLPGSNRSISRTYRPTGELLTEAGSATYPISFMRDPQGRMTSMTTASGNTTWGYHPQRGWLSTKTDATQKAVNYLYTPAGRLSTRTWARGVTTTSGYNGAGELSSLTYSDGTPSVGLLYDTQGRLKTVTDASGTRTLEHNVRGDLSLDTISGSSEWARESVAVGYDALLRKSSVTASSKGAVLGTSGYNYDGGSRLGIVTAGETSAAYQYHPNSTLLASISFGQGANVAFTQTRGFDSFGRPDSASAVPTSGSPVSYSANYNADGFRASATNADGSFWDYGYNGKGEVTSGSKKILGGTVVPGFQFGYSFDSIGNRLSTTGNGRSASYSPNSLNQYTSRDVPGYANVVGRANATATVTVNTQAAERQTETYHAELTAPNTTSPVFLNVVVQATDGAESAQRSGKVFIAKTPESFTYDDDGNLLSDGRWTYLWDGENRLISQETTAEAVAAGTPKERLSFAYDYLGRRIGKRVDSWNGSSFIRHHNIHFAYDGWNLIAETIAGGPALRTYTWGTDFSGTWQGAGGIGGLLLVNQKPEGKCLATGYDLNSNITGLYDLNASGAAVAYYEYGPFGEPLVLSGKFAAINPIRWSTKYTDVESDFVYFGYRYYNPVTGRWISRDPIGEDGGTNLYEYAGNNSTQSIDPLGLCENRFKSLGEREAVISMVKGKKRITGGLTTKTYHGWKSSVVAKESGKYKIDIQGVYVEGEYWWTKYPGTKTHEEHHVTLWVGVFQEFEDAVKKVRGCKSEMECRKNLLNKWADAYSWDGQAKNLQFDCSEYGLFCEDAKAARQKANQLFKELDSSFLECKKQ